MRKTLSVVLAGVLVTVFCSLALAEEKKENKMGKGMMQGEMMGQQGMMGEEGMMMGKSLAATSDGGVVVLVGNKLQKYDKDLVLKKEVEIKIDTEGIKNLMMQMMEKCPMHEKMMQGGMMGQAKDPSEETESSAEMSGHEAHH